MIRVVISSSSFELQPNTCLNLVRQACDNKSDALILFDSMVIQHANAVESINSIAHHQVTYINLSEWYKNEKPDFEAIYHSAKSIPVDNVIIVDGSGHSDNMISSILFSCHKIWFDLDEWQRAFILVCGDSVTHRFLDELSMLFYVSAVKVNTQWIHKTAKKIFLRALFYRCFCRKNVA